MREAGVTLVSLGIFAWARSSRPQGRFEFGWLDRVLDLLHAGGIAVDLATPTAAPPAWFTPPHPEACPVTDATASGSAPASAASFVPQLAGVPRRRPRHHRAARRALRRPPGGGACGTSTTSTATPSRSCYCDLSAGGLPALAAGRATATWPGSTRRGAPPSGARSTATGTQIAPPAAAATVVNPAQQLDFARFCYRRALGHASPPSATSCSRRPGRAGHHQLHGSPAAPASTSGSGPREVDVVSNDHYLPPGPRATTSSWRWPPT